MLFLIISTPRPERPTEMAAARETFWPWIAKYQPSGMCRQAYARVGRGVAAIFDVPENDALHRILNEWGDIIPAHFETYPLIDSAAALKALAKQREP
jgi:hypothetical protein